MHHLTIVLGCLVVSRHVEAGLIPGHSPEQLEAIEVLERTAQRLSLHMVLKVGDIQFVADSKQGALRLWVIESQLAFVIH